MLLISLALLGLLVLPAVATTVATLPTDKRDDALEHAVARGTAVALAVFWLVPVPLAAHGALTPPAVWVVAGLVATVSAAVIARRRRYLWRLWSSATAWVVTAGGVGCLPTLLVNLGAGKFNGSTSWYYWTLADDTIRAHGFPATSLEWGVRLPFLRDYPGFTAATAALGSLGSAGIAPAVAVRTLAGFTLGLGFWLLARRLGASRGSALAAVAVLVVTFVFFTKLTDYRPEAAGYGTAFVVAALALAWIRHGHPADLVIGALALAALAQVHALMWVLAVAFVAGAVLVGLVRRDVRRGLALLGVDALATVVVGSLFGAILPGAGQLADARDAAVSDPTWTFFTLITSIPSPTAPTNAQMLRSALTQGLLGWTGWPWIALAAAVAFVLAFLALRGREPVRGAARLLLAFAAGTVLVVLAFSALVAWSGDTWVPRRTGYSRLAALLVVLFPLAVGVGIRAVSRRTARAVTIAAAAAALALSTWHGRDVVRATRDARPSDATYRALTGTRLPPGALVLANAYTEGFLPSAVAVPGLLDGRAPYGNRRDLARANALLEAARRYFAAPRGSSLGFAADAGVTHVLVATEPFALGSPYVLPTDGAEVDRDPRLRVVERRSGFVLYELR